MVSGSEHTTSLNYLHPMGLHKNYPHRLGSTPDRTLIVKLRSLRRTKENLRIIFRYSPFSQLWHNGASVPRGYLGVLYENWSTRGTRPRVSSILTRGVNMEIKTLLGPQGARDRLVFQL